MARRRTELDRAAAGKRLPAPASPPVGGIEILDSADGTAAAPEPATERLPAIPEQQGPFELAELDGQRPEDVLAEPPDARDVSAELAAPPRRKLPWLTLVLSACVVAAAAFSGGALVEKHQLHGGSAGRGSAFSAAAGSARQSTSGRTGTGAFGASGGSQASGGGAAAGGLTVGTVKLVDGNTVYVSDAQGDIVKVTTGSSTKVTENKSGKVSDLKAGQSVTVVGTKGSDGTVKATTVTEGGSSGGFGGFGGGFGGFGGGSAGSGSGSGSASGN
jgi:hypothetical protein